MLLNKLIKAIAQEIQMLKINHLKLTILSKFQYLNTKRDQLEKLKKDHYKSIEEYL